MTKYQMGIRLDAGPDITFEFEGKKKRDSEITDLMQGKEHCFGLYEVLGTDGNIIGLLELDHVIAVWAKEDENATGADSD